MGGVSGVPGFVPSSVRGRLLVATPPLVDPNFDRTVVLVLEHSENGALGIIINRPSDRAVADVVPGWADLAGDPAVLFEGGPVEPEAVIALARGTSSEATDGWAPLLGNVGTIDLLKEPYELGTAIDTVRLFAGYAGWGGGQLESELASGAWLLAEAADDDAFRADADGLWRSVLARQHGRLAWLANFPDDPSVN